LFHEKIPAPQLSAWLFTATVPVLIQLMGGQSWIWVGIAGVISVILTMLLWRRGWKVPKWQCLILYIYTVLLLSQLLPHAAQSWPTGDATAVPLILLALAVWSAQKGTSAAARTGAVLFWVVLILYLAVFGAGVRDVQWKWLRPQWDTPDLLGLAVFLVPMATASMLRSRGKTSPRLVLLPAFVLVSVLITAGVMSPTVANKMPNAFYEMSRSINLLGIAQRFEPLISAAMTVGWFAFFSLLLSLCGKYAQKIFAGKGKAGVWVAAIVAAAVRLCGLHISGLILLVCASLFWVGFPILTQGIELEKKS
jgi:hypothetical protein